MRTNANRSAQVAWVALFAFALVVGASSFALTYHGLFGYGRDVARLAGFAPLVPVAVDGATLCAIAATFLLAQTPLRVRAYAWAVFFATNALSVLGNLAFAHAHGLGWQGSVGAGAWPVLVTLVAHLGIVAWRHSPRLGRAPLCVCGRPNCPVPSPVECLCGMPDCGHCTARPSKPRSPASAAPPAHPSPAPVAGPTQADKQPRPAAPTRRRGGGQRRTDQQVRALALVDAGHTPPKAAKVVGVSARAVQLWVKKRDEQTDRSPSVGVLSGVRPTPDSPPTPAGASVNGHRMAGLTPDLTPDT